MKSFKIKARKSNRGVALLGAVIAATVATAVGTVASLGYLQMTQHNALLEKESAQADIANKNALVLTKKLMDTSAIVMASGKWAAKNPDQTNILWSIESSTDYTGLVHITSCNSSQTSSLPTDGSAQDVSKCANIVSDVRMFGATSDGSERVQASTMTPSGKPQVLNALLGTDTGGVAKKLTCNFFFHYFGDKHKGGCGPSQLEQWNLYVPAPGPPNVGPHTLRNGANQNDDMTPYLTPIWAGWYGNKQSGCAKNGIVADSSKLVIAMYGPNWWQNATSIAMYNIDKTRYAIPATAVWKGVTYQTSTNGNPGSVDCKVFAETYSPLVIDFNSQSDKGIALTPPNKGPFFDLEGEGQKLRHSWPENATTAFVVLDVNGNGEIDDINEMFGNGTVGPDKTKAANGFLALAKYDLNGDKVIDTKDAVFQRLKMWFDSNLNGKVDVAELRGLSEKRVQKIDLDYIDMNERNDFYGNETKQRSVVYMDGGEALKIFDVWVVRSAAEEPEARNTSSEK